MEVPDAFGKPWPGLSNALALVDINDDGYIDLIIGARGEASAAGAFYVLLGGCDGSADCGGVATGFFSHVSSGSISLSHADARITGEDSSSYLSGPAQTGISVGDVNGDGIDDIFAGAHEDDSSALNGGSAYLFFGR